MNAVIPETTDLSKYIELRPYGDAIRPFIRGRRLPVVFVAIAQQVRGLSISELAFEYAISEEQVHAALLYYYEHRSELDAQYAQDVEESHAMYEKYGKANWEAMLARRNVNPEQS
jgi:uncharacterized protein (DUF433 family)